jgi:hypothetical protein
MIKKKNTTQSIIISFFSILMIIPCFYIFAQNFNLMPAATRIITKQAQPTGDGLLVTTYQFQSRKSHKEILNFYRIMLANDGFKQMKPQKGTTKYTYYFSKQEVNKIAILNFLKFIDKGTSTYFVALHEFDPKDLAKWPIEPEEE